MKELLAYVAKSLVDNPDAVQVKEIDCDGEVILELRVAPEDMGKVIGANYSEIIKVFNSKDSGNKGKDSEILTDAEIVDRV